MARDDSPPFDVGQTYYGGATIDTTDQTSGENLVGKEWVFEDEDYSQGYAQGGAAKPIRSGKKVVRRVVRNASGTTLYAKRLVQFCAGTNGVTGTVAGDRFGCWMAGNQNVSAGPCYPVDEFVGAAGVPPNDLFYIVVQGPCRIQSDNAVLNANINIGDLVQAGTFASSTNSTQGGRLQSQNFAATQSVLADDILFGVGYAMTALTTAQTATDCLVNVKRWD